MARTSHAFLLATRTPAAVAVVDRRVPTLVDTIPYDKPGELRSIAVSADKLWALAGGAGGETTLLRLRRPEATWVPVEWTLRPMSATVDFGRMALYGIGGELWGLSRADAMSTLYRLFVAGVDLNVTAVSGRDDPNVGCATELAESPNGYVMLLSCDNELVELDVEGRPVSKVAALPGVSPVQRRAGRISERIVTDKDTIFVAMNVQEGSAGNARVLKVDAAGVSEMIALAATTVESLAATDRVVAAVIKRADGTLDAVSIPRQ